MKLIYKLNENMNEDFGDYEERNTANSMALIISGITGYNIKNFYIMEEK